MPNATITGWGKALPPAVLSNADLESIIDTDDAWITTRTGIKERRISHVETSEMGAIAGSRALAAAGREAADVDLIILATCTADTVIPAGAAKLQAHMGATKAAAFDLNAACSGFLYGLVMANGMIVSGAYQTILIIGAEKLHYVLDFSDRSTAVLFGDGAGAVVLEATEDDCGLRASELGMDGETADLLCIPGFGTVGSVGEADARTMGVRMEGSEVFRRAVTMMGDASERVIAKAGLELGDIDLLVPHQANVRIIDATARRVKLDPSKVFVNIQSYGNTSAATIPIALTEALESDRVKPGDNLLFAAFGGGLTWGAAVFTWGDRVHPLGESDVEFPPSDATGIELLQPNFDFFGVEPRPT